MEKCSIGWWFGERRAGSDNEYRSRCGRRRPCWLVLTELETFIDPARFGGTCYRAANWRYLGLTTGRGKDGQTRRPNRSLKQLWVYPLRPDFRRLLGAVEHE
ncbi:MAG: hypothetical protein WCT12_22885 [Verrucomicrobiota bacterium]